MQEESRHCCRWWERFRSILIGWEYSLSLNRRRRQGSRAVVVSLMEAVVETPWSMVTETEWFNTILLLLQSGAKISAECEV